LLTAALAVLSASVFLGTSLLEGRGGHAAVPQADTLMYFQYARAMAEGHPYIFIKGDPPSTGSTSHLYPALLALLYACGARGRGLVDAAFALNALFYIGFVMLIYAAARRMRGTAGIPAAVLAVVSGQVAYTFFGLSDAGLFMFLATGTWTALLYGHFLTGAVLMFLAAWARPEGMLLGGVLVILAAAAGSRVRDGWKAAYVGVAGLAGAAGVFLLNYHLTGTPFFQSLAGKSYFHEYPFYAALRFTAEDFGTLVRDVFLGLGVGGRRFFALPVVGGLLALGGIISRDWRGGRTRLAEAWILIAMVGSLLLIAAGEWQGIAHDRYLGWMAAPWLAYLACGVVWVARRLRFARARFLVWGLLAGWQLVGYGYYTGTYARGCMETEAQMDFVRRVDTGLAEGYAIGVINGSGAAWCMPGRVLRNVGGIVTPFLTGQRHFLCHLEWLKHHPERRFAYWMIPVGYESAPWLRGLLGERVMREGNCPGCTDELGLYAAKWDEMESAKQPVDGSVKESLEGWKAVARLDVGYVPDERRGLYVKAGRLPGVTLQPLVKEGRIGSAMIYEIGEVVMGAERFHIRIDPELPVRMVLRTARIVEAEMLGGRRSLLRRRFVFGSPLVLDVMVDGRTAGRIELNLDGEGDFHEVAVELPADLFSDPDAEVTVVGSHASFGYWFYQPAGGEVSGAEDSGRKG